MCQTMPAPEAMTVEFIQYEKAPAVHPLVLLTPVVPEQNGSSNTTPFGEETRTRRVTSSPS